MSPRVTVREKRTVKIEALAPGLLSHTPAGRAPIECDQVEFSFDLADGKLWSVTAWGRLVDHRDVERRRGRTHMRRRYSIDWRFRTAELPDWLDDLVEQYRPRVDGS